MLTHGVSAQFSLPWHLQVIQKWVLTMHQTVRKISGHDWTDNYNGNRDISFSAI